MLIGPRWGRQDSVAALWYGEATFTTSSDPFQGDTYTFASLSDDGSTVWIDLDNDGKFESPDNGSGVNEYIVNNNGDHGDVAKAAALQVPPGTHRIALGFYENGGGATADFKFARGDVSGSIIDVATYNASTDLIPIDPTVSKIATFRALDYAGDLATPSFAGNAVTVTASTTVEADGAAAFGPTTFLNTATVNSPIVARRWLQRPSTAASARCKTTSATIA